MDGILISIGIPAKNCEKTIGSTIDSIIRQSYPHSLLEIILVDDGCIDNTIPISVRRLDKSGISYKLLRTNGRGLGFARQMVVNNSKGKYILWVDGDEIIASNYVERQVKFMEGNPKIGRARGNWKLILKNNRTFLDNCNYYAKVSYVKPGIQSKLSGIGCSISRVKAIKDAGGFDTNIKGAGEDVDLAFRMLECGWDFSVSDSTFYSEPKTSWSGLWKQNFWYGYGGHYLRHKHPQLHIGFTLLPPIAFMISIKKAIEAFKITKKNESFLISIPYVFCSIAYFLGYLNSHFDKYYPKNNLMV